VDKDVVYHMPGASMGTPCPATSGRGAVAAGGLCLNASRWDQLHAVSIAPVKSN
jgi:hypothetical protein